jgi:ApaG protein
MSTATTLGVQVDVESRYHPEHSDPSSKVWLFSYKVRITNHSDRAVQLVSRRWTITHGNGREEQVHGRGVVGEQPLLDPGERFEYTSFCQLETSMGAMHGTYQLVRDDGSTFDATINPFTLADPDELN